MAQRKLTKSNDDQMTAFGIANKVLLNLSHYNQEPPSPMYALRVKPFRFNLFLLKTESLDDAIIGLRLA